MVPARFPNAIKSEQADRGKNLHKPPLKFRVCIFLRWRGTRTALVNHFARILPDKYIFVAIEFDDFFLSWFHYTDKTITKRRFGRCSFIHITEYYTYNVSKGHGTHRKNYPTTTRLTKRGVALELILWSQCIALATSCSSTRTRNRLRYITKIIWTIELPSNCGECYSTYLKPTKR